MRLSVAIAMIVLPACQCGPVGTITDRDSGTPDVHCLSELDCALGWHCEAGRCVEGAAVVDSGFICTDDAQCPKGQQCARSTGQCIPNPERDAGEVDAGVLPACAAGLELSCGQSKLGECRLG